MIWINVIETSRCVCFYLSWSFPVTTKQYYYVIEMETAPISYKKNIYCKHIIYANNMNKIHQYFFFIQPQTILKKKKSDHFQRKHCVRQFIGCPLHPLCTSPCCNRQKKKKPDQIRNMMTSTEPTWSTIYHSATFSGSSQVPVSPLKTCPLSHCSWRFSMPFKQT